MTGLSATEKRLLQFVDEAEIVQLAADLIAVPSENPGGTEAAVVEVLSRACSRLGFEVSTTEVVEGRPNLVATLPGGGADGVMFLGHSDVVPAGEGWTRDPFVPRIHNGRLFGRGSSDMKGGLAAIVGAMAALSRSEVQLAGPIALVCTVDEEDLGLGIRAFMEDRVRGGYRACIAAEPTDLNTVIGCRGDSYLELTITGRPAHSGSPAEGRNAIDAAVKILELIRTDGEQLRTAADPLLGYGTWNTGTIEGGHGTSIVAAHCRMSLDRRLLPDEDPQEIADALLAEINAAGIASDGITVEVSVSMGMPGFRTPAASSLVTGAVQAVTNADGGKSDVVGWGAACDGGFISRDLGIETIVLGPGGLETEAHQRDESVSVDELAAAARAYALICARMLGQKLVYTDQSTEQPR